MSADQPAASGHPTGCICNGTGVIPATPWQAMRLGNHGRLEPQREGYKRQALTCPEVVDRG